MTKNNIIILITSILLIGSLIFFGYKSYSDNPANSISNLISNSKQTTGISKNNESDLVVSDAQSIDLTASYITKTLDGKEQKMLAYNGIIPGPAIRVKQNSNITINFKNDTDIKQLLHSHGVRMDNAFDGSQLSQKEMNPGESFSYKLKFPDAGVYWYHPHSDEVYSQGLGLYGAFVVSPSDANYFAPVNQDLPLMLSDIPIEPI